jgi:O-antigen/teichoic acid export membrane protein
MNKIERLIKTSLTPAKFLSLTSVTSAGLGALVSIINARLLGPEALGLIGIMSGISATVGNFIDVRLMDVVGKLYYAPTLPAGDEGNQYRFSVLVIYILGMGMLGTLIWGISLLAGILTIGYFTQTPVKSSWLVVSTYYFAMNYWVGSFSYQQRFSERFYLIGTWRVVSYMITQALFLLILLSRPTLDGYFMGVLISATLNGLMTIGLSVFIWKRYQGFDLSTKRIFRAFRDYRSQVRLILWGNLFGYSKMLHRGSDILLVGYFADDRITGLYKVARSFTDTIYVLFDALNQVYFPRFMQMLSAGDFPAFRSKVRSLITNSGLLVLGLLGLEALGLSTAIKLILSTKYEGTEGAILVLTIPVFFVLGFHLWYWPIFVHAGKLQLFTLFSLVASGVQYLIAILAFYSFGADPIWAAAGYLGYYLFLTPLAVFLTNRINPQIISFSLFGSGIFSRSGIER